MKKQMKLTAVIFSVIFILLSCEKEPLEISNSTTKKQYALTDLFKNLAPPMQNFTITAGQYQIIKGEKGTVIGFQANSFKRKNGTILASGSVKIILQEILTGPEMILANRTTTSNGKLLISGGQILVKAFLGNEELIVNKNAKPEVRIPTNNLKPMDLYAGNLITDDSIVGDTTINWDITKDSVIIIDSAGRGGAGGTTTWPSGYGFFMDSFRYWNCDQLYDNTTPRTELYIKLPIGFDNINTGVFIYFTSINSVAKCEGFEPSSKTFFLNHAEASVGLAIKILSISKKDNKIYYDLKSSTVTSGFNTTMDPTEISETALKALIKTL